MSKQPIDLEEHGTTYSYRRGCRCDECRAAKQRDWVSYKKEKEKRKRKREEDYESNLNYLGFEGMPPDEVFLMVDLAFHYVTHESMDLADAAERARGEVLALDLPASTPVPVPTCVTDGCEEPRCNEKNRYCEAHKEVGARRKRATGAT